MDTPLKLSTTDDTLRFRLQASKIITQSDVKLVVDVTALISIQQYSETELDTRIRTALAQFVKTDWVFGGIQRHGDAVGFERISLRASSRVPVSEVYDLTERARRAGLEGLSLSDPNVDYSLPTEKVTDAVKGLRVFLLQEAMQQAKDFQEISKRDWRVGDVGFGISEGGGEQRTGKGAYRSQSDSNIDSLSFDTHALSHGVASAERISLYADVILRVPGSNAVV